MRYDMPSYIFPCDRQVVGAGVLNLGSYLQEVGPDTTLLCISMWLFPSIKGPSVGALIKGI